MQTHSTTDALPPPTRLHAAGGALRHLCQAAHVRHAAGHVVWGGGAQLRVREGVKAAREDEPKAVIKQT